MDTTGLHNAGLARRLMACLYDWLLVLAIMMVVSVPVVAFSDDAVTPGNNLYRLSMVVVAVIFFAGFWVRGGQTLGMRAWRLKVVTTDGGPLDTRQALLRFACACIALLPAGLGFFWALINRQKLAWHDQWSGTQLILLPKK